MTRRRGEPNAAALIRFIAEQESLSVTLDEYPGLTDERVRQIINDYLDTQEGQQPKRKSAKRVPKGDARSVVVNTDGASRGNPGPSGAGWIVKDGEGNTVIEGGSFLGRRTNNEAEYEAVIGGLSAAVELGATNVVLQSDSELLVKQINGRYRVKNERLLKLHGVTRELIQRFRKFEAKHVRRGKNSEADALANKAIDDDRSSRAAR